MRVLVTTHDGILEELTSHNAAAIRLTKAGRLVMDGDCESIDEARAKSLCQTDTHEVTVAEAHSGLQKALQYLTGVLRRKAG